MSYGATRLKSCLWPHGGLVSGSLDKTVKVWSTKGAGSWSCLGTIVVHTGGVQAVVMSRWEGRVISGSQDTTIKVSDIVTRQHEATLDSHTSSVRALAVSDQTLPAQAMTVSSTCGRLLPEPSEECVGQRA